MDKTKPMDRDVVARGTQTWGPINWLHERPGLLELVVMVFCWMDSKTLTVTIPAVSAHWTGGLTGRCVANWQWVGVSGVAGSQWTA